MEQMLDGLEKTSSHLAQTLNLPPVDIAGLRREWTSFRQEVQAIPPKTGTGARAAGRNLGRVAAHGEGAEPVGVHGLLADRSVGAGACAQQCAVALASGALRGAAHRKGAGLSNPRRLCAVARRDLAHGFRRLLDARIPTVSSRGGSAIRTGARDVDGEVTAQTPRQVMWPEGAMSLWIP